MPTTIAFINLKGGVAKTTTAVITAHLLSAEHRKRVLVIDLDPQTNATVMLIGEDRWKSLNDSNQTIAQLFRDALNPELSEFDLDQSLQRGVGGVDEVRKIDLLPSSLDLVGIQDEIATIPAGKFRTRRPIDVLYGAVRGILDDYDYVLIDCPPSLGLITLNGLRFADGYVIPVIPDVLSTYGIEQIVSRVSAFASDLGEPIEPYGILATKYQVQQTVQINTLRRLRAGRIPVFETSIPQANDISSAPEYRSHSTLRQKWGYGQGFRAYSAFVDELLSDVSAPASVGR